MGNFDFLRPIMERQQAERLLESIRHYEDLAQQSAEATTERIRAHLADRYRRIVGVLPARRQHLKAALERIRDGENLSVKEAIARVNQTQSENGARVSRLLSSAEPDAAGSDGEA